MLVAALQFRRGNTWVAVVALVIAALLAWWYFSTDTLPDQLVKAAPYAITLLVLGLASQNLRMPKADGWSTGGGAADGPRSGGGLGVVAGDSRSGRPDSATRRTRGCWSARRRWSTTVG